MAKIPIEKHECVTDKKRHDLKLYVSDVNGDMVTVTNRHTHESETMTSDEMRSRYYRLYTIKGPL